MHHMLLELTLLHVPESLGVSYAARIDLVTCA